MSFCSFFSNKLSNIAAKCFNDYQAYFTQLDPCDEIVDVTFQVRIRAYGQEAVKQEHWQVDWRSKNPTWGKAAAGVTVSSKIPEIWCDLRMTKAGLVLPPHVFGHEMMHVLRLADKRVCNPDLLIDESIY